MSIYRLAPLALSLAVLPGLAVAQGAEGGLRFGFEAGIGAGTSPGYFGTDEQVVGPSGSFTFHYLRFGGLEIGDPDPNALDEGFSARGSVRFIGERSADDFSELAGLEDIDPTLEIGGGVVYSGPGFNVFADLRYGLGGSEALVAEVGSDLIVRASPNMVLRIGPRALFGSDDYAATYFGVTAAEATASAFPAFEAEGGLLSAGLEASIDYMFNDVWGMEAKVTYDVLQNAAADSPISFEDDQIGASLVLTRRFDWRF